MPTPRSGLATATGSKGIIYAIGGATVNGVTGAVEAYSTTTKRWTTLASMPTPREGLAAAVGSDGRIYAIGGVSATDQPLATVEAYTPSTNRWAAVASLPASRAWLAAAQGNDGLVYAIGGMTNSGPVADLDAYSPTTNTWTTEPAMPEPTDFLGATAGLSNGLIYAVGGATTDGATSAVETYNPKTKVWSQAAPMPDQRTDMAVRSLNGEIYVVAGYCDSCSGVSFVPDKLVQIYSPTTNVWATGPHYLAPRADLAAAFGPDGRLYGIGGQDAHGNPPNSVYVLTP